MSTLVRCPLCNMETSEAIVNRHLDKGCPAESQTTHTTPKQMGIFSSGKINPPSASANRNSSSNSSPLLDKKRSFSKDETNEERISLRKKTKLSSIPLAEQVRPQSLDDFIGQEDLIGANGLLRQFVEKDICPSIILWGPSGVGKTSFARILAHSTKSRFIELSAAIHGINECKKIFEEAKNDVKLLGRRTILFLDEIHRFNRAQQDVFLPHVEKGDIILIGATTENPSFKLNGALLSRCRVLVLKKLTQEDLAKIITRAITIYNTSRAADELSVVDLETDTIEYLAGLADGDGRIALNLLEITLNDASSTSSTSTAGPIDTEHIKRILQRTHMLYDRVGDSHYDTISALHKSVRGSDADAALFYLGRMLESGEDPLYVARRMIRMASEDIGQADETCLPFAVAAYQAVQQIGMPEADCILAHCAVKLAEAKKSVRVYRGYNAVKSLLRTEPGAAAAVVPIHLRNAPTKLMKEIGYGHEYKYNPNYADGQVEQTYLPTGLEHHKFLPNRHLGTDV